jgi:hypothetical protein
MISAVHGQFDPITLFFLLLALYFWEKNRRAPSGLAFGAAVQSKWWPVMLAPAILIRMKTRDIAVFAVSWLAVFLIFSFHYLVQNPGLLLSPFNYHGVPRDYGITGAAYRLTVDILHLDWHVFNVILTESGLISLVFTAWSIYESRKWKLTPAVFFIILSFYLLCPGWSVQYYAWLTAFMFLFGFHNSRFYAAVAAFIFIIYFFLVVFDLTTLMRMNQYLVRASLAFASLFVIAAAVPMWLGLYKNKGLPVSQPF